jgi:hypothetical protein
VNEAEFHATMLEARIETIERRLAATRRWFWLAVVASNLLTGAAAVVVTLHLAHEIWRLNP